MTQQLAMHSFTRSGREVDLNRAHGDVSTYIEPGVYLMLHNPMRGFFLTLQDPITMPSKVYGDCSGRTEKVLNTFMTRTSSNTGVLLTGNKGSGKTLLAKNICYQAVNALKLPVILIEEAYHGPEFLQFLNSITQPCCVFIDEFEKKYIRDEHQNSLLGLLDGTGTNRKLFLLTSNKAEISTFFLSRPSRIFYHWQYGKLEEEVMRGYCQDNLINKDHLDNLMVLWSVSNDISFDIVQAVVEEVNRYDGESFFNLIKDMNVSLGDALNRRFVFKEFTINDEPMNIRSDQAVLNIVDTYAGASTFRIPVDIDSWSIQKQLYKALGRKNCYFYNHDILEQEKQELEAGNVHPDSHWEEMMDSDINLNFDIDPSKDVIKTDSIKVSRTIGDLVIKITAEVIKGDPMESYFRRLFK